MKNIVIPCNCNVCNVIETFQLYIDIKEIENKLRTFKITRK